MEHYYQGDYPTSEEIMRNRLIDGCLDAIRDTGMAKISIRRIAEKTGIARPTVYKHFRNKNDILAAALQREGLSFGLQVADVARHETDIAEKFITGFIYVVDNFAKNPILAQIFAPGSTFLQDVGMKDFTFAEFGQIAFAEAFEANPTLMEQSEEISEHWIRSALSFIAMPGTPRHEADFRGYIKRRLLPGLCLPDSTQ
ncbi:Tetracycline repressor protein class D [BD1-7 clade bacterium]|uniref:Tetracycline repressor protein class D n=1 Tax=BD1-7 clade bacterium TaxID=2029982 RepID=A0A5S9MYK3_9GAMM|nr:Tetracycline repressor protein class D [BD1-7 clade bacterium]